METNVKFGSPQLHQFKSEKCNYVPPPGPIGTCYYYEWRFKNFMERHTDCFHVPPVYYYGDLRAAGTLSEMERFQILTNPWNLTATAIISQAGPQQKLAKAEQERQKEDDQSPYKYTRQRKIMVPTPDRSYGYKYCQKFTNELMPTLTEKGRAWLRQAKQDLQVYMESGVVNKYYVSKLNDSYNKSYGLKDAAGKIKPSSEINRFYTNIELNNTRFQSFAFATHPDAYNPSVMSKLPVHDLIRILLTPDMKEWLGADTWQQAWIMAKNMDYGDITKSSWEKLKNDTRETIREVDDTMSKATSQVKATLNEYWNEIFN